MVGFASSRPGFTSGTEEEVWSAHPALRSTLYFWVVSLVGGFIVYISFERMASGMLSAGIFSGLPFLVPLLFKSNGELKTLAGLLPFLFCIFPVFWYSLGLACTRYILTTQRLHIRTGILVRTYDQVELFRVRDFMIDAPIHMVLLGLGHVRVISRDESLPVLTLIAMPQPQQLIDLIRNHVQRRKDEVGMREIETNTQ